MSAFPPPGRESKAMYRPSGDQRAVPSCVLPRFVSWTALEPSLSHTQISELPERVDVNTILVPSGEYSGSESL